MIVRHSIATLGDRLKDECVLLSTITHRSRPHGPAHCDVEVILLVSSGCDSSAAPADPWCYYGNALEIPSSGYQAIT